VTKHLGRNIITTLHGTNTSKAKKEHNDDDDDNDTDILDEAIEAPNDSDYHESQPQHPNSTINHLFRSQIKKASQS
jgi:hypothetical protein